MWPANGQLMRQPLISLHAQRVKSTGFGPGVVSLLELEEEAETAWSVGSRPESSRPRRSSVITRLHSPELMSSESNRGDGSLDRLWQHSSCHT